MQQAIPYRTWTSSSSSSAAVATTATATDVIKSVSENAVVVIGRNGCCMCHVVRKLLLGHGVNPIALNVDEKDEAAIVEELSKIVDYDGDRSTDGRLLQFPSVFVGGRLFGGLEKVMATHISGELIPILRKAGALWL